jgi:Phage tail tube protein
MTVQLSHLGWSGLAKEVVEGTALDPTVFIPFTRFIAEDIPNYVRDESIAASATLVRGVYQGEFDSTVDHECHAYPSAIGPLLVAAGFVDTITGAGPSYTHTFKLSSSAAQPPSYTWTDWNRAVYRQYPGCRLDELVITVDARGATKLQSKWKGWKSVIAGDTPTPTFSAAIPFLNWQTALSIGGAPDAKMISAALTVKRATEAIHTLRNNQSPYTDFAGPVEADWKLKVVFEDETEWTHLLSNDQPAIQLVITSVTGTPAPVFTLQSDTAPWVKAPIDRTQKFMQLDADIVGSLNATDNGPVMFVLVDGHTPAY